MATLIKSNKSMNLVAIKKRLYVEEKRALLKVR